MKLFVDDIRDAPDSTWLVCRSVTEAIRCIARFTFDEISLDHDISHYKPMMFSDNGQLPPQEGVYVSCEETFQPVAYYIAAKYWHDKPLEGTQGVNVARTNLVPKITLHTSNPRGAKEMHDILRDVGIPCTIKPAHRDGK